MVDSYRAPAHNGHIPLGAIRRLQTRSFGRDRGFAHFSEQPLRRSTMKSVGLLLLGGIVTLSFWASQARALPPFKKAFEEKYVANSTSDELKAAFKKESCNTCHVKGKEKTVRNDYGQALSKILGGTVAKDLKAAKASGGDAGQKAELDKVLKDLDKAFDTVADEKSPSGTTYGDLIKDGKLPSSK
jgi:hypothetical protein